MTLFLGKELWILKSLLLKVIVGNDHQINFWLFNWAFPFPLINLLNEHSMLINSTEVVSDYICNQTWNYDKSLLHPHDTVHKLCSIPLPFTSNEDEFIWGPAGNGRFPIKSASGSFKVQVSFSNVETSYAPKGQAFQLAAY